ncbi:MAG: DUF58 domain-containing protein [Brevinematia bacterium]
MSVGRYFFVSLVLLACFLFIDFPAAKIITYGVFVYILLNYLYYKFVYHKLNIERGNKDFYLFSGISELAVVKVINLLPFPVHALIVNDQSDLSISVRQVYSFLISLNVKETKELTYAVCGKKRGLYRVGPTIIKFSDFCGIFSFEVELDTKKEIIVFPTIYPFYELPYKSLQPQGNFKNKLPIYEDVSMIKGVKEYQPGDELKRINWKLSARLNKILVNTYLHSVSLDSYIVLNLFRDDYEFKEGLFYSERAIEIAASLAYYLNAKKQKFGFVTNCRIDEEEKILNIPIASGSDHLISIISQLALVSQAKTLAFNMTLEQLNSLKWGISIYVISPVIKEELIYELLDLYKLGYSISIFTVGPKIDRSLGLKDIGFLTYYLEVENQIINMLPV